MITLQNNPLLIDPNSDYFLPFAVTRDSLIDTDIYSRFIHSCENNFRASKFYKSYKNYLMDNGFNRDQNMAGINTDMTNIELHHHFPTLKQATIILTEHSLNTKGCCTTFEIVKELERIHRENKISVIFLSTTQHEIHHANPSDFISLKQCVGDGLTFINEYKNDITLDIAFNILLQLKMEDQYGTSFSPNEIKMREEILSWIK